MALNKSADSSYHQGPSDALIDVIAQFERQRPSSYISEDCKPTISCGTCSRLMFYCLANDKGMHFNQINSLHRPFVIYSPNTIDSRKILKKAKTESPT